MSREEMRKAAAELVADWPTPTRQQLADVAVLMRPGIEAVRQQHSQRTTVRKAA